MMGNVREKLSPGMECKMQDQTGRKIYRIKLNQKGIINFCQPMQDIPWHRFECV